MAYLTNTPPQHTTPSAAPNGGRASMQARRNATGTAPNGGHASMQPVAAPRVALSVGAPVRSGGVAHQTSKHVSNMNNAVLIASVAGAALIAVSAVATYLQSRNSK